MKNHKTGLAVLFLFLLNFLAGLFFMNEGIFNHDSVVLAQAVENTYKTGALQPAIRGRYGSVIINSALYFPFFLSGQNADFTTRFSSVLFGALSVAALFLFINELFESRTHAFFGAMLFSFTPFCFSPNTYGKEHGAAIFFLLFSFYLLWRGLKQNNLLLVGLSSLLFAFSVSVRESMLTAVPLYFLLYLNPRISLRPFRMAVSRERFNPKMLLSLILPFLAAFSVMAFTYLGTEFHKAVFVKDTCGSNFLGLFSPVLRFAIGDLYVSIPLLLFAFFVIGITGMCHRERPFFVLFLSLWLGLLFYFGNIIDYKARLLDMVIIPVYIFASYALADLCAKYKIIAYGILAYFVASMFIFMYPMLEFRRHYNGEKQFALYVREKTEPDAVIIAMDDGPFIEYYGRRKYISCPLDNGEKLNDFIKTIDGYLKRKIPLYLAESTFSYDPRETVKDALFGNYDITTVGMKLAEDYHRPELRFQTYAERLFKLKPKEGI